MTIILQNMDQLKEIFRPLPKDDIFSAYISDQEFRSTNVNAAGETPNACGYDKYFFDLQYQ